VQIQLPAIALKKLRLAGLLEKNRDGGIPQISAKVFSFMDAEYDSFLGGLRKLLGLDMSGPEWVDCHCSACRKLHEDADRTPLPRHMMTKGWVRAIEICRARTRAQAK
jgi:hypothetical protein